MNSFYTITESLNSVLKAKGFRNINLGDQYKTDIMRQTIFPYALIIPETSTPDGQVTDYTFRIIGMDLVDFNKDDLRDEIEPFYTTDNLQDVFNDIHNRFVQVIEQYQRGDENSDLLKLVGASLDAFFQRGENLLAGWELTITIQLPTGGSIC